MSSCKFIVWLLKTVHFALSMQRRRVIGKKCTSRVHTQAHLTESILQANTSEPLRAINSDGA